MRINLRLCISLALFSAAFSQFAKSDSFNNVIDDFDSYLKLEQEGKLPEKPLNIQAQGYDSLSSLPLVAEPKKQPSSSLKTKGSVNKPVKTNTTAKAVAAQPKKEAKASLSECPIPEINMVEQPTGSAQQSLLLSSYPYFFNSNQWHPQYLSKDFAKYQVVLDPLGLYSSKFSMAASSDNSAYLEQLADLLGQQQSTHLFKFGVAQGTGQLIAYHQLLTDRQLVEKLIAHNKSVAELSHTIAEKQFEIERINAELASNKSQIALLQEQLKVTDDQERITLLTDELTSVKNNLAQKQNDFEQLTSQNQNAQQLINTLEAKLSESVSAQLLAEKQLAEKNKQVEDAQQQINQLTSQLAQLEMDSREQTELLAKTRDEQLKSVNADLAQQQVLLKQKEAALQLIENERDEIKAELEKQQDVAKVFEADLE
ncbi:hypothetical protein, partial [Providencia burhodogranariea]